MKSIKLKPKNIFKIIVISDNMQICKPKTLKGNQNTLIYAEGLVYFGCQGYETFHRKSKEHAKLGYILKENELD